MSIYRLGDAVDAFEQVRSVQTCLDFDLHMNVMFKLLKFSKDLELQPTHSCRWHPAPGWHTHLSAARIRYQAAGYMSPAHIYAQGNGNSLAIKLNRL